MAAATKEAGFIENTLKAAVEIELLHKGCFKLVQIQKQALEVPLIDGQLQYPDATNDASASGTVVLRFQTPLRLQVAGKPIFTPSALSAELLFRAMTRRYLQWCQVSGLGAVNFQGLQLAAKACEADTSNLHWHDISRHSGQQNRTIPLGGLIGQLVLRGPRTALQALYPLLRLGQTLHIGKEAMVGLGQYQLGAIEPL
jgi:CRISPR/Cas system endoribonuclease Cas6 (RAMP superfamily)